MGEMVPTRDGFGREVVALGKKNDKIMVLSADLEDATRAEYFKFEIPERFINVGIAEQDMIGTAAGLSLLGFIPFACSFSVFLTNRGFDMIRQDVCYNNLNVKLVGSHAGVTVGEDGGSAQCLEDIAILRVLPNIKIVCPVDHLEAEKATRSFAQNYGPMYLRTSRAAFPVISEKSSPFEIGKANRILDGEDVSLIACGIMVSESLQAAAILKNEGIRARVINMHTIKPIDEEAVLAAAQETGAIVTAEEHQIHGGLGGAVAEILGRLKPVPMEIIGVKDVFGVTGAAMELLEKFHLKGADIAEAARRVVKRKKKMA
jgi:transketolase